MHHFIYKTISSSGKYYVGRHTTLNLNDGYYGSGRWVRQIKDKSILSREILSFHETFEELLEAERIILEEVIDDPLNMNFNISPVGFSSGELNPSHRPEQREKSSKRCRENNPGTTHTEETRNKIREFMLSDKNPNRGRILSEQEKRNISIARTGYRMSDVERQKLSIRRKEQYKNGERTVPSNKGNKHSIESKEKMRIAQQNRPRKICEHCGIEAAVNTFSRWHGDNCRRK